MKTIFTRFIGALILATGFTSCVWAGGKGEQITEKRNVSGFSSIEIKSVGLVYFTQASDFSCSIEGEEGHVKNITTSVEGNTLKVSYHKKLKNNKNGTIIRISAPDLKQLDFSGVGSFNIDGKVDVQDLDVDYRGVGEFNVKDLHCRKAEFDLSGVGEVNINLNCEEVRADVNGIGSATFTGTARMASFHRGGIGELNTQGMKIGK